MGSCWRRLKWLVEFAIDYGSIALFLSLAVVFQLSSGGGDKYGESDPGGLFGVLFAVFAVKLWHDVREDHRRG
jgi:hypothetical protein